MPLRAAAVVAVAGAVVSLLSALVFGLATGDALEIVGVASGAAIGAGVVGAAVLHLARRRAIALQSGIAALTSVAAVAAAMVAASSFMFSASSEAGALAAILIVAGTVGVLVSLALGNRIASDRRTVVEATRRVGRGGALSIDLPATEEFADVANELQEISAQLDRAQARERSLDRSRRELVAWISHDLRTPLARLRAVIEALEDEIVGDPKVIRAYYRTLDRETLRLSALIDDLFELSRISAGALELQLEALPLAELVSDVVAAATGTAAQKRIVLDLEVAAQPRVRISSSHVERALDNLVDNAIRHTPRDGRVRVRVEATDERAQVLVEDNCGGIPEAELAQLLSPPSATSALEVSSTRRGLGLLIARGLVEAHAGTIAVENTDTGCRFTITVPRQRDA